MCSQLIKLISNRFHVIYHRIYIVFLLSDITFGFRKQKVEKWEQDARVECDWLMFDWNKSSSYQKLLSAFRKTETNTEDLSANAPEVSASLIVCWLLWIPSVGWEFFDVRYFVSYCFFFGQYFISFILFAKRCSSHQNPVSKWSPC